MINLAVLGRVRRPSPCPLIIDNDAVLQLRGHDPSVSVGGLISSDSITVREARL